MYLLLGLINCVLLGAFALILANILTPGISDIQTFDPAYQLNLQSEGTIPVWYHSALLVVLAVTAVLNFWNDRTFLESPETRWRVLRYGWLLLAGAALAVSVDETAVIREVLFEHLSLTYNIEIEGLTNANPGYLWVALIGPLMLVCATILAGFFVSWVAAVPRARRLALVGVFCWALVPVFEALEAYVVITYGHDPANVTRFFEESLEIVGSTLLLIASLEYLIGRARTIEGFALSAPPNQLWPVLVGAGAPLILVPAAVLGVFLHPDTRVMVADTGYLLSAGRIARVMDTAVPTGHHLLLSEGCNRETVEAAFRYDIESEWHLLEFPPPGLRQTTQGFNLRVVTVDGTSAQESLAASLRRLALMSSEVWHLQCGAPSAADKFVRNWLAERFTTDRYWFPGFPPVELVHASIQVPWTPTSTRYEPIEASFGSDLIHLLGSRVRLEHNGERGVLRIALLWEKLRPVEKDFHIFVHLVDSHGRLIAQSDGLPVYGRFPFSEWPLAEPVPDQFDLSIPPNLPLDEVHVQMGLYDFENGQRLPVNLHDDHVVIDVHPD